MRNYSAGNRRQELAENPRDRTKMLQRRGYAAWRTVAAVVAAAAAEIQGCWFGAVARRCRVPPAQPVQVNGIFQVITER